MNALRKVRILQVAMASFAAYPKYINTISSGTGRALLLLLNPPGSGKQLLIGRCNFTPVSNGVATAGRNIQLTLGTYTGEDAVNLNASYSLVTPATLAPIGAVSVARLWLPTASAVTVPVSLLTGLTQMTADQLTYSGGRTFQKKLSMMTTGFRKIVINPGGYLGIVCSTGWLNAQMTGSLVWSEE